MNFPEIVDLALSAKEVGTKNHDVQLEPTSFWTFQNKMAPTSVGVVNMTRNRLSGLLYKGEALPSQGSCPLPYRCEVDPTT